MYTHKDKSANINYTFAVFIWLRRCRSYRGTANGLTTANKNPAGSGSNIFQDTVKR